MTDLLYQAVQSLAGMCDGARTHDGAGFNKLDSPFGKQLASRSFEIWTAKQKRAAWAMLGKYRKQLLGYGINYNSIEEPPAEPTRVGGRNITVNNDSIVITFPYRPDLVAEVKTLPNRRWDGMAKVWTMPAAPEYAAAALEFARRLDFNVDEALRDLSNGNGHVSIPVLAPFVSKSIALKEYWVEVTFPYVEHDRRREDIKNSCNGTWDKTSKTWRVPLDPDSLKGLEGFASAWNFPTDLTPIRELKNKLYASRLEAIEASQAATADIEIEGLGGVPYPFQLAGAMYAIERKRVIIADEMGLGKTIQALITIQALQAYPALITCPASLKLNWYREAHKWLPGKTFQMLGVNGFGRADANITIINYDQLVKYQEYLTKRGFHAIICDESHYLKSPTTQRTKAVEEIAYGCVYGRRGGKLNKMDRRQVTQVGQPIPVRLFLTGTPVMNEPLDLIPQLQTLDRIKEFGNAYRFKSRYGYGSFLKELNERLRASCFVRRLKSEVLKELPPKVYTAFPVEIDNREEYAEAEKNLIEWLRETKGDEKAERARRAEQLVRISELKQLAARGKISVIKDWVTDFLDTGQKLVLFAWHKEIVRAMAGQFHCGQITGDTPLSTRDEYVNSFQKDPLCKLLACNILAGGVGLTLTAASNVLIAELPWNPAQLDQAIDRCHRIGQTDSVTAWLFLGVRTIEERIARLIDKKRKMVLAATDGIESTDDMSILDDLVSELMYDNQRVDIADELPF